MELWVRQPDPIELELVAVGESRLPPWWEALLHDDSEAGAPEVLFRFEVRDGVPECREIRITATEGGQEVRYSGLAGIRVEDVLEQSAFQLRGGTGEGGWAFPLNAEPVKDMRRARAARKVKVTDALLREVADVYRANVERQPTQAVAHRFDKAHRTAGLYVRRARDQIDPETGKPFLGAATIGKAGER